jgi:hypothetical protein
MFEPTGERKFQMMSRFAEETDSRRNRGWRTAGPVATEAATWGLGVALTARHGTSFKMRKHEDDRMIAGKQNSKL